MKKFRIGWDPCVVVPHDPDTGKPKHIIHATEWRAQRNANLTAVAFGYFYHRHSSVRRTLWGWLTRSPKMAMYDCPVCGKEAAHPASNDPRAYCQCGTYMTIRPKAWRP